MPKFWIDFKGYCLVEAPDKEQAEMQFFENIYPDINGPICNEVYEVEGVEELVEDVR